MSLPRFHLTTEPPSEPSLPSTGQPEPTEGPLSRIFLSQEGLRAGWRLLLYAALWWIFEFAFGVVAAQFVAFSNQSFGPQAVAASDLIDFASAYAAARLRPIHTGSRDWVLAGSHRPFSLFRGRSLEEPGRGASRSGERGDYWPSFLLCAAAHRKPLASGRVARQL